MGTGGSEPCLDVQWSSYYRWWSPINHWAPAQFNLCETTYRNVQLLSLYVNSVHCFHFFSHFLRLFSQILYETM